VPDKKKMGRPVKEFDKKTFVDLVGLDCDQKDICWFFRDDTGKPANIDTLSRWCKREFGMTFQEFSRENKGMAAKIKLRQNQLKLSERSAVMAIFLGKNLLGQRDDPQVDTAAGNELLQSLADLMKQKS
jgi:hypothetical protein